MRVMLADKVYDIEDDKVPLGLWLDVEDKLGLTSLDVYEGIERGSAKATLALLWVIRRAAGEDVTFDQIKLMTIGDIDWSAGESEPSDPTAPAKPAPDAVDSAQNVIDGLGSSATS